MTAAVAAGDGAVEYAYAKVNLHLHVVGRREDGYHLLDSLVVFAAAARDVLRVRSQALPAPPGNGTGDLELGLSGPFGSGLAAEVPGNNLVSRAAAAWRAGAGRPTPFNRIELEKHLPVASGIGGGSADAAAMLRLLDRISGGGLGEAGLRTLAAGLGADVPVCVAQRPALMGGVGEILRPAPLLPACGLLLVNPGSAVSTPAVFRARAPGFRPPAALPASWPDASALADTLRGLHNDLEDAAIALCPPIGGVLAAIGTAPGCLLARMSGSGATCFGLFAAPAAAEAAAEELRREGWWCSGGALLGAGNACATATASH